MHEIHPNFKDYYGPSGTDSVLEAGQKIMLMDARAPEQIKNPYIAALITAYVGIFSSTPCPPSDNNSTEILYVTKRYSKQVFCIKMYRCQQKITAATESSVAAAFYFKIKISSYKTASINLWFF